MWNEILVSEISTLISEIEEIDLTEKSNLAVSFEMGSERNRDKIQLEEICYKEETKWVRRPRKIGCLRELVTHFFPHQWANGNRIRNIIKRIQNVNADRFEDSRGVENVIVSFFFWFV